MFSNLNDFFRCLANEIDSNDSNIILRSTSDRRGSSCRFLGSSSCNVRGTHFPSGRQSSSKTIPTRINISKKKYTNCNLQVSIKEKLALPSKRINNSLYKMRRTHFEFFFLEKILLSLKPIIRLDVAVC